MIDFALKPETARQYVRNFKHVLGREATYVETPEGRRIDFATMTDEDAIWVATQLQEMERKAATRSIRGKRRN